MVYTIRPATILDIHCFSSVAEKRFENDPEIEAGLRDRIIEASHRSQGVWIAADNTGTPAAIFGVSPLPGEPQIGLLWMLFLKAVKPESDHAVLRLVTDEMLEHFSQIENYVDARKPWALDLMRSAGFTVEEATQSINGEYRHRVWRQSGASDSIVH